MAASTPPPAAVPNGSSSLSFTQGFLLGQLSIALLIFCFIKFFIFGPPPSPDERALHLHSLRRARLLAHQQQQARRHSQLRPRSTSTTLSLRHKGSHGNIIRRAAEESRNGPSIATILSKTYYNVSGHQPESLDWFNVLIAQTIAQLRTDARHDDAVLASLNEGLNGGAKPDWVGEIRVTEVELGEEFPIFSNCRVMPAEEGLGVGTGSVAGSGAGGAGAGGEEGRLQARMDVDLSDVLTLGIETTLNLNWPSPLSAVLPVALAVSIIRFSGTLAVSFIPSSSPPPPPAPSPTTSTAPGPQKSHPHLQPNPPLRPRSTSSTTPPHRPTTLAFTFLSDYRLDLSIRSLVGSRSRLQDVPKIAQLVESRLHAWFDERVVEPRVQQIVLPSLWPRRRNTRGGGVEEEGQAEKDGIGESAVADGDEEDEEAGAGAVHVTPATPPTLEARIAADGAALRAAERRAGERGPGGGSMGGRRVEDGVRYRGGQQSMNDGKNEGRNSRPGPPSRFASNTSGTSTWTGARGMPGSLVEGEL